MPKHVAENGHEISLVRRESHHVVGDDDHAAWQRECIRAQRAAAKQEHVVFLTGLARDELTEALLDLVLRVRIQGREPEGKAIERGERLLADRALDSGA